MNEHAKIFRELADDIESGAVVAYALAVVASDHTFSTGYESTSQLMALRGAVAHLGSRMDAEIEVTK